MPHRSNPEKKNSFDVVQTHTPIHTHNGGKLWEKRDKQMSKIIYFNIL